MGGLSINSDRLTVVDFTTAYRFSPVVFTTQAPKIINNSKLLFTIFSKQIWFLLLITLIIIGFFLRFIFKMDSFTIALCPLIKQSLFFSKFNFKKSISYQLSFRQFNENTPKTWTLLFHLIVASVLYCYFWILCSYSFVIDDYSFFDPNH